MSVARNFIRLAGGVVLGLATLFVVASAQAQTDPLQPWNDTVPKAAIVAFVEKVTKENSPDFVPEPERIAVFDNDGTLWVEHPMYAQLAFALDHVKAEQLPIQNGRTRSRSCALPQRTISLSRNPD